MINKIELIGLLVICLLYSCSNAPDFNEVPSIEFIGISKPAMQQSSFPTDSLTIIIGFEDGDGDLGFEVQENRTNLFIIDAATQDTVEFFKTPFVPLEGANNGITGEVYATIYTTCCTYPDGSLPCEPNADFPTNTINYQAVLVDRAGNFSNVIDIAPITLLCN